MVVEIPTVDELKREYRLTYAEYARQADQLEKLRQGGQPDSCALENAVLALERARLTHSAARDQLAQRLGAIPDYGISAAAAVEINDGQIRHTAHLLWEFSGQPGGTAERDWHRARQLVKAAGNSR